MINSSIYSLVPNKKITLTVNSVNINKPAVSAGFINLMYIWQYQSKWLKLGKFASNNNWVDLVDYRDEKTTGKFVENQPIALNYYSVFGYKVDFRLVIYSKNSKKINIISKNSLSCYQEAIISNLIQTICNDDKNVQLHLKSSSLVINQTIKLAHTQTIDFLVQVDGASIYENNQTSDQKSSSVRIIFELNNKHDDTWKEIGNFPLLFQNHIMQPINLPINFDQSGSYVVRAKIALEKSWQIAPIFSNEIKVVLTPDFVEMNFSLLKMMIEYEANSFLNSILLTNPIIKQINSCKLNWLKWQVTNLINQIDSKPTLIQKIWMKQVINNNEWEPLYFCNQLFLTTVTNFDPLNFLISKHHLNKVADYQLERNQNLVIAYPNNNSKSVFWGLLIAINHNHYPFTKIINAMFGSNQNDNNFENTDESKLANDKLMKFLPSSLFLNISYFAKIKNFSLFDLAMQNANNETNFDWILINHQQLSYLVIAQLWINKNWLHNQQLANWKAIIKNSLLDQGAFGINNLNLTTLNTLLFNWVKVIEHTNKFLLVHHFNASYYTLVEIFNLDNNKNFAFVVNTSPKKPPAQSLLIFPNNLNYYLQLPLHYQICLLAINFRDFFKN